MVRKVVQFQHTEQETTIPDNAEFWFDLPVGEFPRKAPFSLIKSLTAQVNTVPAYSPVIFAALHQSLSGAGAISVVTHATNFTSTGATDALTLADGTIVGQLKVVTHVTDGGSGIMTPTNFVGGTKVTFTTVGERWEGIWTIAGWQTLNLSNVSDGGVVLPVIA